MAQFEPLLWERPRRTRRRRISTQSFPPIDPDSEFAARPLGELGRLLLCEVEIYLEFFALAREPARGAETV